MKTRETDLAIIGGGPAGMAAALAASMAGLKDVLVIERAETLGGLLHQCIHNGFGLQYFKKDLTGPEYAEILIDQLADTNCQLYFDTMVTHFLPDKTIMAINRDQGELSILPKAVVLAMGCREKSRFSVGIPGTRPAGIFTAGTAQRLVNVDNFMPGKEFVILGSGDIGMIMARRLHLEGATVRAVVEMLPRIGGLIRNEVQCLQDFQIPLLLKHTVTNIYGNNRIEGVEIAQVDEKANPITGTEKRIKCDTLLLSVGLVPENELSREACVLLDERTGGPLVDEFLQTTVDGVFAAGNVLQVYDLVDNVTWDGERAGANAARYVAGRFTKEVSEIRVFPGANIKSVTPQRIKGGMAVEIAFRVREQIVNGEIRIGTFSKKTKIISPNEVVKVVISSPEVDKMREVGSVTVECN